MVVVKRPFKNYGEVLVPGSIVEPGTIKRYKSRLTEGYLVEVTEQDFDTWAEYFKVKHHVTLQKPPVATTIDPPIEQHDLQRSQPVRVAAVVK